MATSTVLGARGTAGISSFIRKTDMADTVLELEPNAYPLTVLSNRLGKEATVNPEYSWVEDDLEPRFDAINNGAGYSNSATSIVVDNGNRFQADDLVKDTATGEVFRVTAVSTNTLTVVRGIGGGAAAMSDNDELLIIGSATPEGALSKPARSGNPTKITNYTQIIRTPWESTETLRHSDTFVRPADWTRQANHKGIEHAKDWEYISLFGRPSEDTSGSQPRRTTGGVLYFINTNITDAGGTLTEQEFFGFFGPAFRYGSSDTKLLLASRLVVDVLNAFPRGKLQTIQADNDKTYGINVMQYVSPHGRLNVVTHNLLEGSKYGGYAICLDMTKIKARPLANSEGSRDTHIRENIQPPDADTRKDEYLTERGMQVAQDKAHALLTGVTG